MCKAIDVYLEKRKTRLYVGRLSQEKPSFVFEYSEPYMKGAYPIAVGPDLPLGKKRYSSLKLFPSFEDYIPSKRNPAYKEYCQMTGISPDEEDLMILLSAFRKGPSSFVLEPVFEKTSFSGKDLKKLRQDLKLSIREFADVFNVSSPAIYRIENNKASGKQVLEELKMFIESPILALDKIHKTGTRIHESKRIFVEDFFEKKIVYQFCEKLSTEEFCRKRLLFGAYLSQIPWKEKSKGLKRRRENAVAEISVLCELAKYHKPTHIQWTGEQSESCSYDGLFWMGKERQKIEITALADKEEQKSLRKSNLYEGRMSQSLLPYIKNGIPEAQARKFIGGQIIGNIEIQEDEIYKLMVYDFQRKAKKKYQDCWLIMPYQPHFFMEFFHRKEIHQLIFKKLKKEKNQLYKSIKKIFKKIIFLPMCEPIAVSHRIDFHPFELD